MITPGMAAMELNCRVVRDLDLAPQLHLRLPQGSNQLLEPHLADDDKVDVGSPGVLVTCDRAVDPRDPNVGAKREQRTAEGLGNACSRHVDHETPNPPVRQAAGIAAVEFARGFLPDVPMELTTRAWTFQGHTL